MTTVGEILTFLETLAPRAMKMDWDNVGLLCGGRNRPVTKALVALDPFEGVCREASQWGAELIVTHHPLIFSALRRVTPDDAVGLAVMKAIRGGVAIYSAHTSADKVVGGVSWAMARRIGLENVTILDVDGSVCGPDGQECGLGIVGDFPEPVPAEKAVEIVKSAFRVPYVKTSRLWPGLMISRVAACGGSGSSLIAKAREAGAQLYVCGDISYHHFFTPEGFILMDVGHYESEIDIVDILFSLIRKNFHTFAVRITRLDYTNPIYYF